MTFFFKWWKGGDFRLYTNLPFNSPPLKYVQNWKKVLLNITFSWKGAFDSWVPGKDLFNYLYRCFVFFKLMQKERGSSPLKCCVFITLRLMGAIQPEEIRNSCGGHNTFFWKDSWTLLERTRDRPKQHNSPVTSGEPHQYQLSLDW